jgi:hypothetical protein
LLSRKTDTDKKHRQKQTKSSQAKYRKQGIRKTKFLINRECVGEREVRVGGALEKRQIKLSEQNRD